MKHLLVTNDFPPKVGGIQTYLWELWRRLPPEDTTVLTTSFTGDAHWDAAQPFRVERVRRSMLVPTPSLVRRVNRLADEVGAELVLVDPAWPLGLIGPRLERAYGLVVHGSEITVPARLVLVRASLRSVLRGASVVVAAGPYPAAVAERAAGRALRILNVPPGVDIGRFRPFDAAGHIGARAAARASVGLPVTGRLVLCVSRLVPRKGFDVVLRATAGLAPARPDLVVAVVGVGRDRARLERLARREGAPVRFLGRLGDEQLADLYAAADVFAMLCRDRWAGLEQEGFGIVFLEAAASGVAQLAGASGGSADAVLDGTTGLVLDRPRSVSSATAALGRLLDDDGLRHRMGAAARARAVAAFDYQTLAARLGRGLTECALRRGVPAQPRPQ